MNVKDQILKSAYYEKKGGRETNLFTNQSVDDINGPMNLKIFLYVISQTTKAKRADLCMFMYIFYFFLISINNHTLRFTIKLQSKLTDVASIESPTFLGFAANTNGTKFGTYRYWKLNDIIGESCNLSSICISNLHADLRLAIMQRCMAQMYSKIR